MMSPQVALLGLNGLLVAAVAFALLGPHAWWAPPPALLPELPRLTSAGPIVPSDEAVLTAVVERPLFFESRRPLPKEAPADQANAGAPDPFEGVVVDGFYSAGNASGGVSLVDREGKRKRVMIGATLGDWELVSLSGREAKFHRQGAERVLALRRAQAPGNASAKAVNTRAGGENVAPVAASVPIVPAGPADQAVPAAAAVQYPPAGGPTDTARTRALEARRQALQRRQAAREARRKQIEAPGASSRPDPFGHGDAASQKP